MERRGFLGLLGAAVAAPLVPAQAGSRALFDYAVSHAQKFPVISVGGLSKRGDMSLAQAEEMMRELASRGMVRMVSPSRGGAPRAASKIMVGDHWGIGRTRQPRHVGPRTNEETRNQITRSTAPQKTVPPWLAHLHDLCRAQGMVLSHRCFA